MEKSQTPRVVKRWRVVMVSGEPVEQSASKLVVTVGGALLFLRHESPLRIIAPGRWRECYELTNRREVER